MSPLDADASGAVDARSPDQVENAATTTDGAIPDPTNNEIPEGELPEGGVDEGLEPVEPAIDAPVSLNAEEKAAFAQLPPEAQRMLQAVEARRNGQVQEATTRASAAQREAEATAARAGAEAQARFAQQLQAFASHYAPQRPNPGHYDDMQQFARDNAQYEHDLAQHQQLMQQISGIGAEAGQQLDAQQQQWAQAEAQQLRQAYPEWFDEAKAAGEQSRLTAIGAELGYTPELMAQAGANDILALRKAADWKAKAEKYDSLMKGRMQGVRAAKQTPPNARGQAPNAQAAPVSVAAQLYPNDVRN